MELWNWELGLGMFACAPLRPPAGGRPGHDSPSPLLVISLLLVPANARRPLSDVDVLLSAFRCCDASSTVASPMGWR